MATIGLGLMCLGCVLLSLSLRRHYRQVFSDASAFERRLWPLRLSGYGCVLLALWPCIAAAAGLWVGVILWISMLTLGAFVQIMLLTYRPRHTATFGALGAVLVALGALL